MYVTCYKLFSKHAFSVLLLCKYLNPFLSNADLCIKILHHISTNKGNPANLSNSFHYL